MKCIARCKSNIFKQCSFTVYGSNKLCIKHCSDCNIKTIEEELFTKSDRLKFIKEYLDIIYTNIKKGDMLIKKNIILAKDILQYYNYNFDVNLKNKDVLYLFKDYISIYKNYILNIDKVIKIQSLFRKNYIQFINKLKGPGLFNRKICTNEDDFYTFENKNKISFDYFFSYKEKNIVYCFDIRSFKLLIEKYKSINPYTRIELSNAIKDNANKLISYLKNNDMFHEYLEETLTEEQTFNQYIIQIFQKIDSFGYNTNVDWFKKLSLLSLKKMWINLEDIWNYRSNLSINEKNKIININAPKPFKYFKNIHTFGNKKTVQNYILEDIDIFISNGIDNNYSNIGCLYVLTALSSVSNDCLNSMSWLQQTF